MPDMPGHIARPRFLRLHDEYLNASRENRRRFGLGLLSGDPVAGVYRHLRIGTAADWRHLEREFYAEEGHLAYWPYNRYGFLGNKQEILRQGALETIRVVEGLPASKITRAYFQQPWPDEPVARRLESWWVCMGHHSFEIDVLDGDVQVTMIIMTPAMPFLPDNRKPKLEKDGFVWTVGDKHVLEVYLGEYRSDQSRYPVLEPPYKVTGHGKKDRDLRRLEKFTE